MGNLVKVEEIAGEKALRYGGDLIQCVKQFCDENDWKSDVMPDDTVINFRVCIKIKMIYNVSKKNV